MSQKVGLLYEPFLINHKTPDGEIHVERPERITAIYTALLQAGLVDQCQPIRGRMATNEEILAGHYPRYVGKLITNLTSRRYFADRDLYANTETLACAELAAGSTIELVNCIIQNQIQSGFALVRPPGHHACSHQAAGFCFFNNVALAAIQASNQWKKRTLIVDFDIHIGDGTMNIMKQEVHRKNANLKYFSIHRWDNGRFYPGGQVGKSGLEEQGRILKVGFTGSKDDAFYLETFKNVLKPFADEFQPELIIVSAGFDAAKGDPLGGCEVTPKGYYQMTKILQSLCPKIALILEGGYNLQAISQSSVACLQALLGVEFD